MDWNPPGSSVHGILQARILEWGCYFLLQGIFPTQWSNLHPLYWQADSLPLHHLGSLPTKFTWPYFLSLGLTCKSYCIFPFYRKKPEYYL